MFGSPTLLYVTLSVFSIFCFFTSKQMVPLPRQNINQLKFAVLVALFFPANGFPSGCFDTEILP